MASLHDNSFEVIRNGRVEGPFTFKQLQAMNLNGLDFVKPSGYDDFKEVREIKVLSEALAIAYETVLPQYFATLDTRLLSNAIDYLLVSLVYAVSALLWMLVMKVQQPEMIRIILYGLFIIPALKFLVNVFTESSARQASPGKMAVGIKVCRVNGGSVSIGRATVRNAAKLAGILTCGIGFLSGFFDRRQQCLHDKIAGTLVIRDRLI